MDGRIFHFDEGITVKFEDTDLKYPSGEILDKCVKPTLIEVKRDINEDGIERYEENVDDLSCTANITSKDSKIQVLKQIKLELVECFSKGDDNDENSSYSTNKVSIGYDKEIANEWNVENLPPDNKEDKIKLEDINVPWPVEPNYELEKPILKELKVLVDRLPLIDMAEYDIPDVSSPKSQTKKCDSNDVMFMLYEDDESCQLNANDESARKTERKTLYTCKQCQRAFVEEGDLTKHMEGCGQTRTIRTKDILFNGAKKMSISESVKTRDRRSCSYSQIEKYFYWEDSLPPPSRRKCFKDDSFKCSTCGETYDTKKRLHLHLRTHTKGKPHKCDICNKAFSIKEHLLKHNLEKHSKEKPVTCKICGKCFKFNNQLEKHLVVHTGEKPYKCDICGKTCSWKGNLQTHLRMHSRQIPFQCKKCRKGFTDASKFERHMLLHKEQPFKCDLCGKGFLSKDNLNAHLLIHANEKKHKCNVCGKAFSGVRALNAHLLFHEGRNPHKCKTCGQRFTQPASLRRHLRIHTGEMPFKCIVCGREFNHLSGLSFHRRTHTKEKPFSCDVCRRKFARKADLRKHFMRHTGEKPHECAICGKKFREKITLRLHHRRHTGEKPYECQHCGKCFVQRGNLQRHFRVHTGEMPYECNVCGKKFRYYTSSKRHSKLHAV